MILRIRFILLQKKNPCIPLLLKRNHLGVQISKKIPLSQGGGKRGTQQNRSTHRN